MIETDREPVNKDASMALSKGNPHHVGTVEEALRIMGERIASGQVSDFARNAIESGVDVVFELKVSKKNGPGFVATLKGGAVAHKKVFGNFIKLL